MARQVLDANAEIKNARSKSKDVDLEKLQLFSLRIGNWKDYKEEQIKHACCGGKCYCGIYVFGIVGSGEA